MHYMIPFTPSLKPQLLIGLLMAIWVYVFLVFVGPYDSSPLSIGWRAQIMIGYAIVFVLCYGVTALLQHMLFKKLRIWNFWLELIVVCFVFAILLPSSFWYYKSQWILGEYAFYKYLFEVYLPTLPIVFPLLFLIRWLVAKGVTKKENLSNHYYVLTGQNKLDVLRLRLSELICIVAANNYIEAYYLNGDKMQKKILRTTLTKVQEQIPELVKTHRSYLINPDYFIKWEDGNRIALPFIKVPVSRNYKSIVAASIATRT